MLSLVQGAVPGAGDALNAFLGYYFILRKAKQAELSKRLSVSVPELINKHRGLFFFQHPALALQ